MSQSPGAFSRTASRPWYPPPFLASLALWQITLPLSERRPTNRLDCVIGPRNERNA